MHNREPQRRRHEPHCWMVVRIVGRFSTRREALSWPRRENGWVVRCDDLTDAYADDLAEVPLDE